LIFENENCNDAQIDELYEASLIRVYQCTREANMGIITAHLRDLDPAINYRRSWDLRKDIALRGLGFIQIRGRYIEEYGTSEARIINENSFLVLGKKYPDKNALKGNLKSLGRKYDQELVIYKAFDSENTMLLGTKKRRHPAFGQEREVGRWHPNRTAEFHAMMRDGDKFVLAKYESRLFPYIYYIGRSFFGRMERLF
jgi:hypothetical protein